jgi:hypothetical protein
MYEINLVFLYRINLIFLYKIILVFFYKINLKENMNINRVTAGVWANTSRRSCFVLTTWNKTLAR